MSLLKYVAIGAAVAYGVKYLTKKGADGKSVLDNLQEKAPEYVDQAVGKVKAYGQQAIDAAAQKLKEKTGYQASQSSNV